MAVAGVDELYAQDGRNIVCIDPGHGGEDLGNVRVENGRIVLQEKDFVLEHSLMLAERLREKGFEVVLTRETDTEVNPSNEDVNGDGEVAPEGGPARTEQLDDLQARVNICNLAAADLLVSVHYNGAENEFLSGYEVWFNDDREFSGRSEAFATFMHEALAEAYAECWIRRGRSRDRYRGPRGDWSGTPRRARAERDAWGGDRGAVPVQ